MALTRMRGASACASVRVALHRAGLGGRVGEEVRRRLPHALVDDVDDVAARAGRQLGGEGLGQEAPAPSRLTASCASHTAGSSVADVVVDEHGGVVDEAGSAAPAPALQSRDQPSRRRRHSVRSAGRTAALPPLPRISAARRSACLTEVWQCKPDLPAVRCQVERQGAPDALGGAGDEDGWVLAWASLWRMREGRDGQLRPGMSHNLDRRPSDTSRARKSASGQRESAVACLNYRQDDAQLTPEC